MSKKENLQESLPESQLSVSFWDTRITRREFNGLLWRGAALVGATSLLPIINACSKESEPQEVKGIRKELGEWTEKEVEFLAKEMQSEPQFSDIARAGEILFNNQRGNPSLSTLSPLFSDFKIRFTTVKDSDSQNKNKTSTLFNTSMKGKFVGVDPIEITLKSKSDGSLYSVHTYKSMQLEDVIINHAVTEKHSDFLFKFFIASHILSASVVEMVTSYIKKNEVDPKFILQDESDARVMSLLIILLKDGEINKMPASFVASRWSQFMMLPDYDLALREGRFSTEEIKELSGGHGIFSKTFQGLGILIRNPQGRLEWTNDKDKLFSAWIKASEHIYKGQIKDLKDL